MAGTVNLKHTGAQIDEAINNVSSLLTRLGTMSEEDYNTLKATVSSLQTNINNYGTNIKGNSEDITKISNTLNNLTDSLKGALTRITETENKQESFTTGLSSKVETDAYNAKIKSLDAKDEEQTKTTEALRESFNNGYNDLSSKINTNSASIATNADNLDKLTKVFGGTEEATALVEKISKLNLDTINGLTDNVDEIVNEIRGDNGIEAQIATIRNTYATKEEIPTDYATTEQLENYMLATEIESLTNSLAARIDTLEEKNTTLENTIADLQKQIDTLKGEINNANSGQ